MRRAALACCAVLLAGCGHARPASTSPGAGDRPAPPEVQQALDGLLDRVPLPPGATRVSVAPVGSLDGDGGDVIAGRDLTRTRWWTVAKAPDPYMQRLVGPADAVRLWYRDHQPEGMLMAQQSGGSFMGFTTTPAAGRPVRAELAVDVAADETGAAIRATARTCVAECVTSGAAE